MECAESKKIFLEHRKKSKMCTDTFWLCLFIIFWGFLIVLAAFAIIYGNYLPIINGYDSFGNVCGVKHNRRFENFSLSGTDTSKKPYVFFFTFANIQNGVRNCIEQCPDKEVFSLQRLWEYFEVKNIQLCRYDFEITKLEVDWMEYRNRLGPCPAFVFDSRKSVRSRCVPTGYGMYTFELYSLLNTSSVTELIWVYIYLVWHYVAALSGFSFVISITLLIIIRWLPKIASWLIWFLAISSNTGLCVLLWNVYNSLPLDNIDYSTEEDDENIDFDDLQYYLLKDFVLNKRTIYMVAVFTSVITVGLFLATTFFLKTEFSSLTMLLKETGSYLNKLPGLMLVLLITLLAVIAFFSFSMYVMLCIATSNYPEIFPLVDNEKLFYFEEELRSHEKVEYLEIKSIRNSLWVYIVGFMWTSEFIFACEEFTVGAAIAFWYFRRPITSPPTNAIGILLKHHLGTVAKGSVTIMLLRFPRLVLTYLLGILNGVNGYFCFKRYNFEFGLFEKWIGTPDHTAYIVVAMQRIDFIPAARIAWNTMEKDVRQIGTISNAAHFVLFLGKLFVANTTCLLGIILLKDIQDLYFYMPPVILSTLFAFCIAHTVLSIFEMSMDALLLCISEDRQINGSSGRWKECLLAKSFGNEETKQRNIQVINVKPLTPGN